MQFSLPRWGKVNSIKAEFIIHLFLWCILICSKGYFRVPLEGTLCCLMPFNCLCFLIKIKIFWGHRLFRDAYKFDIYPQIAWCKQSPKCLSEHFFHLHTNKKVIKSPFKLNSIFPLKNSTHISTSILKKCWWRRIKGPGFPYLEIKKCWIEWKFYMS